MKHLEKSLELLDKLFQEQTTDNIRAKIKEIDRLPDTGLTALEYFNNLSQIFDYNQLISFIIDESIDLQNFDIEELIYDLFTESVNFEQDSEDYTYSPSSQICEENGCNNFRFAA